MYLLHLVCAFLSVNYMGKDFSGTIYIVFHDQGQILKIWDCPEDSITVGAYAHVALFKSLSEGQMS